MLLVYSRADAERQVVTCMSCQATYSLYKYFSSSSCTPDAGEEAKHSVCAYGACDQHRRQLPKNLAFLCFPLSACFPLMSPYVRSGLVTGIWCLDIMLMTYILHLGMI